MLRALFVLVGMFAATAAPATPPISAYGQLPAIDDPELSPDGARFAAVIGDETARQIQIREVGTNTLIAATPIGKSKLRDLLWVGPNHVVATVSSTAQIPDTWGPKQEWFQVLDFNLATKKWRPLLNGIENTINVIAGEVSGYVQNGTPYLLTSTITFPDGTDGKLVPFRINLDSGRPIKIMEGTPETIDWLFGADGQPVARADYSRGGDWRLFVRYQGAWKKIWSEVSPIDRSYLRSLGPADDTILVGSRRSGEWATHVVNLADGSWSDGKPEFDVDGVITDPVTGRPIGTVDGTVETTTYNFFNPADQKLWNSVRKAFPGELVSLASWSDDRNRIIVEVDGPTNGAAYFIVDRAARAAAPIAPLYPGVAAADYNPVQVIRYAAADGFEVPAYLTLPKGRGDKNLPLVVLPHGGPAARDRLGFDWCPQALASRGYAVLQPQFRGSKGYGSKFERAGDGEWGRKMQTDVSDGVRHLANLGTIDPKRVCIVGGSYGGYAALAGVTVESGVYRCASGVAGVYDLPMMLNQQVTENTSTMRYWRRVMGGDKNNDPRLIAVSPARLAARANGIPIQLIHGKDDTVVRYEQTEAMTRALTAAGNPPEVVTLVGEDHGLSRGATRLQMLTAQIAFLEKHNPPGPAPASAGR
ncbi:hypothetical protein IP88_06705 [alpha proteobacterium AAP81b]|nr:hypothetical protein IP88_06705 [alpha proteobacterium AAP81b]